MWRNHIAHLVAPLSLLVVLRPPVMRLVALAAIATLPLQAAHLGEILSPDPYAGDAAAAAAALRALPEGARAISDDPGFVVARRTYDAVRPGGHVREAGAAGAHHDGDRRRGRRRRARLRCARLVR